MIGPDGDDGPLHPLPWELHRRHDGTDTVGTGDRAWAAELWDVVDAEGTTVMTVAEPDHGTDSTAQPFGLTTMLCHLRDHADARRLLRDAVVIERRAPMVAVSVPGVAITTIGADIMGEFPDRNASRAANGRRDAMLLRTMLADALERVDAQLAPAVRVEARPLPDAVQLAARHLDTEVEAAHLTGSTASAVRTVLRELMTR